MCLYVCCKTLPEGEAATTLVLLLCLTLFLARRLQPKCGARREGNHIFLNQETKFSTINVKNLPECIVFTLRREKSEDASDDLVAQTHS